MTFSNKDRVNKTGKWLVAALMLALIALLAACGQTNAPTKEGQASTAPEGSAPAEQVEQLQELTVLLDWYPNAVHSFLYATEDQGYFEEAGLKVNFQVPADTNDALRLVAAGKADLAISYQMQVAISRSENIPIVSVAALVRHPLNQLFVLADKDIESPKDLAQRKIGFPSIPLDEAIVDTMVASDGGDPAAHSYIDVGWDLIPAMTTGRVDAIIGGYVNHEKLLLEKEGIALKAFVPSDYGVPDFHELVLTASEDGLSKREDAIGKFVGAIAKGFAYTQQNPDKALALLLEQQSGEFPLDQEIEQQSLQVLLPLMDAGDEPFGQQNEKSWQEIIDWLSTHNMLNGEVVAKEAFKNW